MRFVLAEGHRLAERVKRLPSQSGGVMDPRFVGDRVTARRRFLIDGAVHPGVRDAMLKGDGLGVGHEALGQLIEAVLVAGKAR